MNPVSIAISKFTAKTDINPASETIAGGIKALAEKYGQHAHRSSKDGAAFSPTRYREGGKRGNADLIALTAIVLDFDGVSWDAVRSLLVTLGWQAWAYSTYSHTPEQPHFRVVLSLDREITDPSEMRHALEAAAHVLGGDADRKALKATQMFYLPACPVDATAFNDFMEGEPLAVEDLLSERIPAKAGAGSAKGYPGTGAKDEPLTIRELADAVVASFESIVFVHGRFRAYKDGCWEIVRKPELMRLMMKKLDTTATSRKASEVLATLEVLVAASDERLMRFSQPSAAICLTDGTLDLSTQQLGGHDPDHGLKRRFDLSWQNHSPEAPQWDRFLESIWGELPDYRERVHFIEEWMGQLLLPSNRYGLMLWMYGPGKNGKSIFAQVFSALVRDARDPDAVTALQLDQMASSAYLERLVNAALNVTADLNSVSKTVDGVIKSIVTGDEMTVMAKYEKPYTITPSTKLLALMNSLPRISDTTEGFRRRLAILTFPKVISEAEQDPFLIEKLLAEKSAILGRAIRGLMRLIARENFLLPPSAVQTVADFMAGQDPIQLFMDERVIVNPQGRTTLQAAYEAYESWRLSTGFSQMNRTTFSQRMEAKGLEKYKSGSMCFRIELRNPEEPLLRSATRKQIESVRDEDLFETA